MSQTTALQNHQDLTLGSIRVSIPLPKGSALFRALADVPQPLPMGAVGAISKQLKVCRREIELALKLHRKFKERPELRAKWESQVLSGRISPHTALKRIAAKDTPQHST